MKRINHRNRAFTLVEIMIVVLIIGILMAIAVPNFVRTRDTSRSKACISNLKEMDQAKDQWAMDNKEDVGASVAMTDIAGATLYIKVAPSCPGGGTYTLNNVGTKPTCDKTNHALP